MVCLLQVSYWQLLSLAKLARWHLGSTPADVVYACIDIHRLPGLNSSATCQCSELHSVPVAGLVLAASFIGSAISPGNWAVHLQTPFMVGSTVMGYLVGTAIPSAISTVLHPLVTCALVANLGAYVYSLLPGFTFDGVAKAYMTKVRSIMLAVCIRSPHHKL